MSQIHSEPFIWGVKQVGLQKPGIPLLMALWIYGSTLDLLWIYIDLHGSTFRISSNVELYSGAQQRPGSGGSFQLLKMPGTKSRKSRKSRSFSVPKARTSVRQWKILLSNPDTTKRHKTLSHLSQTMLWQQKKDGQWPHKNDSMESHPSKPLSIPSAMKLHEVRLGHHFPELLSGCLKVLQWSNWKVEIRWCLEMWGEQPLHWAVVSKFVRLQASGWGWHIPKGMSHQNQPFFGVPFCFRHGRMSGFHRQEMITDRVKLLWGSHVSCQERDICFTHQYIELNINPSRIGTLVA